MKIPAITRSGRAAKDNQPFRFEVEDTGIGIAPGDIGKLFVEFQRGGVRFLQAVRRANDDTFEA